MAKDTRIAFRASVELKERLQRASKKVKLGETALAEAAVEAAVEYIEKNGGIWFPLRVVPEPDTGPPGKPRARGGQQTGGRTDVEAARGDLRLTDSPPASPHVPNETGAERRHYTLPAKPARKVNYAAGLKRHTPTVKK